MSVTRLREAPGDLFLVLLAGAVSTLAILLVPDAVAVRAIFGLPFLLIGPGYAVTSALYPREPLGASMRLLLTLGLSVSSIILVGLALNAVRIELTGSSLAISLLLVALGASTVAALRRGDAPSPVAIPFRAAIRSPWLLSVVALLAVFAVLLVLLARALPNTYFAGFTQLTALRAGPASLRVTVESSEHESTGYTLVATAASGRKVIRLFRLAPGGRWAGVLQTGPPSDQTIHVRLYRAGAPHAVYREVTPRA